MYATYIQDLALVSAHFKCRIKAAQEYAYMERVNNKLSTIVVLDDIYART